MGSMDRTTRLDAENLHDENNIVPKPTFSNSYNNNENKQKNLKQKMKKIMNFERNRYWNFYIPKKQSFERCYSSNLVIPEYLENAKFV